MQILAINCGSSTLKFQLFRLDDSSSVSAAPCRLAGGLVDRIGSENSSLACAGTEVPDTRQVLPVSNHAQAVRQVLDWLEHSGLLAARLDAVGHRVVHGGDQFSGPALLDQEVLATIEDLSELAPLHNLPALAAIRGAREHLGEKLPMAAVFDTAFHRNMPPVASQYAIRPELAEKHRIHRFGFHGLAHQHMTERYAEMTGTPPDRVRIVTLQLGNGCSAAAVSGGRSVDTSMGFTPLEGLVMGTRSGDVDPSLAGFLSRREGIGIAEVEDRLNRHSGLLGISGVSRDMRELLELEKQGHARATLAIDMFCYRTRKYIGAYLAALGGAEAVVFGGGIGENSPVVRERICRGLEWSGLRLDRLRNAVSGESDRQITADGATVRAFVVRVDEERVIARETAGLLRK